MNGLSRNLRRLRRDKSAAVAMLVALSLPVLIGAAALSIDIANFRYVQGRLQSAADAGALAAISKVDKASDAKAAGVDYAGRNVPTGFGTVTQSSDVEIGIWDPVARSFTVSADATQINAVRVSAVRNVQRRNGVPTIFLQYFDQSSPNMQAQAVAARQLIVQYEPPEKTDLDNEAWDYNRLYAYCYKYSGTGTAASRRSQMSLIADNIPTSGSGVSNFWTEAGKRGFGKVPSPLVWPECAKGESLSFRLENIREVKQAISNTTTTKNAWAAYDANKSTKLYNHYTDTTIASGVETFGGLTESVLETVRCDTKDLCDPNKTGTVIPKGKNRTPQVSGLPCLPGKYMYFGWEDRPPTHGSDRDYDDIRILMRCPKTGTLGDGMSRLVS
ncbi:hypothetical protein FJQ54_07990 [Sandaracinobacter neustonicus]|uniref:DUF2134 domain-containing protein n=1 Tax=Sandaracinobacter neustonicus TaxID=1715348 RepID=A0A501XNF8_9SPHN|nr:TadG family pilus assembly protein [Sandaracinobacter neustonicus]TPE61824.1 hypothetical protein FJQ54_07990 [Sandaracinobacter neustonicus]